MISKRKWLHEMLNIRHFQFFDLVTAFDYSTKCESCILPYQCLVSPFVWMAVHFRSSAKLQQSGPADHQNLTSTYATMQAQIEQYLYMNFGHLCQKKMPSPSGEDGRQPIHCLPYWRKILQLRLHHRAYVERVFSVCGWLTAGCRNRLSKNLEMRVFLKLNKDLM